MYTPSYNSNTFFFQLLAMQRGSSSDIKAPAAEKTPKAAGNGNAPAKGRVNELKPGGDKMQREGSKACVIQ